jgi:hypothetical protein
MVRDNGKAEPQRITDAEWDTLFELMGKVLNLPVALVPVARDGADTEEEVEQIKLEARAIVAIEEAQQRDADGTLEDFVALFNRLQAS